MKSTFLSQYKKRKQQKSRPPPKGRRRLLVAVPLRFITQRRITAPTVSRYTALPSPDLHGFPKTVHFSGCFPWVRFQPTTHPLCRFPIGYSSVCCILLLFLLYTISVENALLFLQNSSKPDYFEFFMMPQLSFK